MKLLLWFVIKKYTYLFNNEKKKEMNFKHFKELYNHIPDIIEVTKHFNQNDFLQILILLYFPAIIVPYIKKFECDKMISLFLFPKSFILAHS
jgi:hypothetical protein